MAKEIKSGTLTELLLTRAVTMMRDKWITSVELILNDETVTLIYRMHGGQILRDSWKIEDLNL